VALPLPAAICESVGCAGVSTFSADPYCYFLSTICLEIYLLTPSQQMLGMVDNLYIVLWQI